MTPDEEKLILDLISHRVSNAEFIAKFNVDPGADPTYVVRLLEDAWRAKDASGVEFAMYLGFHFKSFNCDFVDILCKLLGEDWHKGHEDIAWIMQELKDPACVEPLYGAALADLPYLAYDDARALSVKAMWALSDINTRGAREKLRLLKGSENKVIRENAERLLARSEQKLKRH